MTENRSTKVSNRSDETEEKNVPDRFLIGDFIVEVVSFDNPEDWGETRRKKISGKGWLHLGCLARNLNVIDISDPLRSPQFVLRNRVREVVPVVKYPQTQISLQQAMVIRPDVIIGQHLEIPENISKSKQDGGLLVDFEVGQAECIRSRDKTYRITKGAVSYPQKSEQNAPVNIQIENFVITISGIIITPDDAKAVISLQLPECLIDKDTCDPATLDLGEVEFTPTCEFYVENPEGNYGPWIMISSGLVISGKGFTADFTSSSSSPLLTKSWKGLILTNGIASGETVVPTESNTGYLAGKYSFLQSTVTSLGFDGILNLQEKIVFYPINPLGYTISAESGELRISQCHITDGWLQKGSIVFPEKSVCVESGTRQVEAPFSLLTIDSNLDVTGEINLSGTDIGWGERTNPSDKIRAWTLTCEDKGYVYFPGNPQRSYCPDNGSGFIGISFSLSPITDLKNNGITGITIREFRDAGIHSSDRVGGRNNPISFPFISQSSWIHIGCCGIDGELEAIETLDKKGDYSLGNPSRKGYDGRVQFNSTFTLQKKPFLLGRFIGSAVIDSNLEGEVALPQPCLFTLPFAGLMVTSTADLLGGDIQIPPNVKYDYWRIDLIPLNSGNTSAGFFSVRTGRIVLTAAGLQEKFHFSEPFRVTWGEIFADGNIGDLFFDFNSTGQKFDKIHFSPHNLLLSKYHPGDTKGYLAVGGTVHFNFFGQTYVNIHDAREDGELQPPFNGRLVTVPKVDDVGWPYPGEEDWEPTDLELHGEWNAKKVVFDCPDSGMSYNGTAQDGFIGTGSGEISFIHSPALETCVEIHGDEIYGDNISIRISSTTTHDVDFGLYQRYGSISQFHGCARIRGPLLERVVINGVLEHSTSTGHGIVEPKAGEVVETLTSVTPSSCTHYLSGGVTVSVATAEIDAYGTAFFSVDFVKKTMEGNFQGRIDGNSPYAAIAGEGQVTWFIGPTMQVLQGNIKVAINSWIGGIAMEGGLFMGVNTPLNKAWVLQKASPHYKISDYQLPDYLTGVYAYGRAAFEFNAYVFGGGIELYAGLGAFLEYDGTDGTDVPAYALPCILGRGGIYLHGEILGGLVSAGGWAVLQLYGPPFYFEGSLGLEACVLWVICGSVSVTAGISHSGHFYLEG